MLAVTICLGFASCNDDDDDVNGKSLVGTSWKYTGPKDYVTISFVSETSVILEDNWYESNDGWDCETHHCTYTYDAPDGRIYGSNWSQPFTISGELLTLYKDNSSQATVFIKQ